MASATRCYCMGPKKQGERERLEMKTEKAERQEKERSYKEL